MADLDAALERLRTLRRDFKIYAPAVLKLRNKAGQIQDFTFNPAQEYLHDRLEHQKSQMGWVRALVLKGRQQGVSTYTAGRFYHRTSLHKGINTYILAHEQSASDTLFGIVDRYQRSAGALAPHVGTSNLKELEFDQLDSSYNVATAGAKAGGRGKATSLFHGSEVAFWPNAKDHFAASVQSVPLLPGTEVILESTSAGAGGDFYERCQDAEAGRGDYILVFLPWWLSPEYSREPELGFALSREEIDGEVSEEEYRDLHKLTMGNMAWRRAKMQELRDPLLFRREYPATSADAWTAPPGHVPYIDALLVLRARKRSVEGIGPLVIGVDPASQGGDRFSVAWRRGLRVEKVEYRNRINHEEGVAWIRDIIDKDQPARVNIDAGNIGANMVTSLKNLGPKYVEIVRGVNFGGTSEHRLAMPKIPGPYNRRAEMWKRMKDFLELAEGVSIPDDGAIQADLVAPKQKPRLDNFMQLESKEEMKNRGIRSPDMGDAIALTFAFNEIFEHWHEPKKPLDAANIDDPRMAMLSQSTAGMMGTGRRGWMGQ